MGIGFSSPGTLVNTKSRIPCSVSVLPVEIVVQMTGVLIPRPEVLASGFKGEAIDSRSPRAPPAASFAMLGNRPCSISRSMMRQVAPSMPITMTFELFARVATSLMLCFAGACKPLQANPTPVARIASWTAAKSARPGDHPARARAIPAEPSTTRLSSPSPPASKAKGRRNSTVSRLAWSAIVAKAPKNTPGPPLPVRAAPWTQVRQQARGESPEHEDDGEDGREEQVDQKRIGRRVEEPGRESELQIHK